jgi:hypothetical protein
MMFGAKNFSGNGFTSSGLKKPMSPEVRSPGNDLRNKLRP